SKGKVGNVGNINNVKLRMGGILGLRTWTGKEHIISLLFSLFTFLLDTDTVKIIALCTIGSDPFLYLETLCVNMFSLCVCICDLCMYVGEVYKCISVFVYVYKLLDDLNFP